MQTYGSGKGPVVEDPEVLRLAKAGADWFCTHCDSGNIGNGDRCESCGSPRYAIKGEDHPDLPEDHKFEPPKPDKVATPAAANPRKPKPEKIETPPHLGSPPPKSEYRAREEQNPHRGRSSYETNSIWALFLAIGGVVSLVGGCGAFVFWSRAEHEVVGQVSDMSWFRQIQVQAWTDGSVRKWKHEVTQIAEIPPTGGTGERAGFLLKEETCTQEHYSDETYVCGTHEECKDKTKTVSENFACTKSQSYVCGETCKNKKNAFEECVDKTCTKDVPSTCTRKKEVFDRKVCVTVEDKCKRAIMRPKCDFITQDWVNVRAPSEEGKGVENLIWPMLGELGPLERGVAHEAYVVTISYKDKGEPEAFQKTLPLQEYLSWSSGQNVYLKVNNLGIVTGYSPTHQE